MPSYQHKIENHRLFPIESRGDTLIVTPRGDSASFANLHFNLEHSALLNLLSNGSYKNVLVDLSRSNYFGAKVLGAISEWAKPTIDQGGKVAVCGASSDMKELLNIYELNDQFQQFPTREAGIKAIVKETSLQSMQRQWKMGTCLLLFVAFVGASYWIAPYYSDRIKNERDYQTIASIWDEMQRLKATNASAVEWRQLRGRAERELEPIIDGLEGRAGSASTQAQVAQCLFHASKHYILNRLLVERNRWDLDVPTDPKEDFYWHHTEVYLEKARRLLAKEDTSDISFRQEDYNPLDTGENPPPDDAKGDNPPQDEADSKSVEPTEESPLLKPEESTDQSTELNNSAAN